MASIQDALLAAGRLRRAEKWPNAEYMETTNANDADLMSSAAWRITELEATVRTTLLAIDAAIGALEDNNASDALSYLETAKALPKSA